MFKGLSDLASLFRNAGVINERMQSAQEDLKRRRAMGSAGGGLVEIELNGLLEVLRCSIDPSLIAQNDRELLEDMVLAAVNQAIARGRQLHAEALQEATSGVPIPGLRDAITKFAGEFGTLAEDSADDAGAPPAGPSSPAR